jgi:hypothetical protein
MNARTGYWAFGCLATLAVACGGGSSKPATPEDYCAQRAEKECKTVADSCSSDNADCQDARKQVCLDEVEAIMAPRVFKPGNMSACLTKTASVYAQATITPADLASVQDVCGYVFQGDIAKLDVDHPCTTKFDCKDANVICDKGLCADKVTKGTGALCTDPGAVCGAAEYCAPSGTFFKCTPKKGNGEACDATTPCLDTLRCVASKCVALLKLGDACTANSDCPTDAPYCDPFAGNECTKGLKFATHSPSCGPFGDTKAPGAAGTGGGAGASGSDAAAGAGGGDAAAGSDGGDDATAPSSDAGDDSSTDSATAG